MSLLSKPRAALALEDGTVYFGYAFGAAGRTAEAQVLSDTQVRVSRVIRGDVELVWRAHHDPDLVRRWMLGPDGWTMPVCEIDLRVGGAFRYEWRNTDGSTMGMGGEYRAIEPPERIENSEKFDEAWYEGEAHVTQRLVEHAGGRRMTLTLTVLYDSRQVRDGVLASPMKDGVTMCYDRLAKLLAEMK